MTELDKAANRAEELIRELWTREPGSAGMRTLEIDHNMLKLDIIKQVAITAAVRGSLVSLMLEGL